MYYSSINSLKDAIGEADLIKYVNDDSRLEDEIDLEDEDDPCRDAIDKIIKKVYDESFNPCFVG